MNTRSLKYISLICSCISMAMISGLMASEDTGNSTTPVEESKSSESATNEEKNNSSEKTASMEESTSATEKQDTQLNDFHKTKEPVSIDSQGGEDHASGNEHSSNPDEIENKNFHNEEDNGEQPNDIIDVKLAELVTVRTNLEATLQTMKQAISSLSNNRYVDVKNGESKNVILAAPKVEEIADTEYGYLGDQILKKMRYQGM